MRVETKKVFITKESDHEGAEEIAFFSEENCRLYEELTNPSPEIRNGIALLGHVDDKFIRLDPFHVSDLNVYHTSTIVVKTEKAKQYLLSLCNTNYSTFTEDDYPMAQKYAEEIHNDYTRFDVLERATELPAIIVPDTNTFFCSKDNRQNVNRLWREMFTLAEFREIVEKYPDDDMIREFSIAVEAAVAI